MTHTHSTHVEIYIVMANLHSYTNAVFKPVFKRHAHGRTVSEESAPSQRLSLTTGSGPGKSKPSSHMAPRSVETEVILTPRRRPSLLAAQGSGLGAVCMCIWQAGAQARSTGPLHREDGIWI